jgi:hypothetical protein
MEPLSGRSSLVFSPIAAILALLRTWIYCEMAAEPPLDYILNMRSLLHCKWRAGGNPVYMSGSHLCIPRNETVQPPYFQNRIIMISLPNPTLVDLWEIYIFPGLGAWRNLENNPLSSLHYLLQNRPVSVTVCVEGVGGLNPPPPLAGSVKVLQRRQCIWSPVALSDFIPIKYADVAKWRLQLEAGKYVLICAARQLWIYWLLRDTIWRIFTILGSAY